MSSEQHFNRSMLAIQEKYLLSGGKEPFELHEIATWAINNNLYDTPIDDKIKSFCNEMRRVLRCETHKKPNGVSVRTFQCVRAQVPASDGSTRQGRLWADIRRANTAFVLSAFDERHKAARCDVRALQVEVEAWNEFDRPKGFPPIQLNWDFSAEHGDEGLAQVG